MGCLVYAMSVIHCVAMHFFSKDSATVVSPSYECQIKLATTAVGTRLLMLMFWWVNEREEEVAAAETTAMATSEINAAMESEERAAELMATRSKKMERWKAQERLALVP
jgi:hypothetical protein